jgi:hypothetical protein
MDTGPCFNDPHPANKRVDMALVDVAATTIVVAGRMELALDRSVGTGFLGEPSWAPHVPKYRGLGVVWCASRWVGWF